ncbi:hypothetical protein BKA82DRAFT_2807749 [Pisolithus tinctorius]|nr:hypothetical protein BKA82DRAFT_2807749 [Pisolithus tinctorius]
MRPPGICSEVLLRRRHRNGCGCFFLISLVPAPHMLAVTLCTLDVWTHSLASRTDLLCWTSFNEVTDIRMYPLFGVQSSRQSLFYPCHNTPSAWPRPMLEPYQAYHPLRVFAAQARRRLTLTDNDMVRVRPHSKVFLLFHDSIVRSRYEALPPFYIIVQTRALYLSVQYNTCP